MTAAMSDKMNSLDPVTVTCVTEYAEFRKLEHSWSELHDDSIFPSIYNSFLMIDESIKAYGEGDTQLRIFVLQAGERLIAIFPLELKLAKWKKLSFNEYKPTCDHECVDKPYPVIRHGYHDVAWRTIMRHLRRNRNEWQCLSLREVPASLPTLENLPRICREVGLICQRVPYDSSPLINLNTDWGSFLRKHRSLRRKLKRLERDFGERFRFEVIDNNWEWCLRQYNALEKKTWKHESGIDTDEKTKSFYHGLLGQLDYTNKLVFGFIFVDDKVIAADITYLHGDTAYFAHACFDPEYHRYSPSMVCSAFMLRHFYDTAYKTGDYLCGYAHYMNSWSDAIVETSHVHIFRPGLAVALRLSGRRAKKILAWLKSRLPFPKKTEARDPAAIDARAPQ